MLYNPRYTHGHRNGKTLTARVCIEPAAAVLE